MSDIDDIVTTDVFGLDGSFPCPGWRVLDAARSHRFTGEVTCATIPATKVYFDAGQIYFAERVSDPSLGARLVDAGALSAAQLEHGSMFVGGIAHLGRLFERVGSVDRHQVLLVAELMTEERVGWLAGRLVAGVTLAPYRHHPTGVRRWAWSTEPLTPGAADPFPAPSTGAAPTGAAPTGAAPTGAAPTGSAAPESGSAQHPPAPLDLEPATESFVGGATGWEQPSGLDRGGVPAASSLVPPAAVAAPLPAPAGAPHVAATTPPEPPADTGADADGSTPVHRHDAVDRFEVIWPSGEVDEQVEPPPHIDTDPTSEAGLSTSLLSVLSDAGASAGSVDSTIVQPGRTPLPDRHTSGDDADDSSDAVALAVRRAVATIETGSLEARRRFAAAPPDDAPSPGDDPGHTMPTPIARSLRRASALSVFDDAHDDHFVEDTISDDPQVELVEPDSYDGDERAGALRRLIDSMRRG